MTARVRSKTTMRYLTFLAIMASPLAPAYAQQAPVPAGFTSLFDGTTLNGWRGDPTVFSVRDGAITGGSDKPIDKNTYLILNKPYANFEIRFKYRFLEEVGNSGLQFRSGDIGGNFFMAGPQANITPLPKSRERFAMLYDEIGEKQEMVLLGQKATITRAQAAGGGQGRIVRTVTGMVNDRTEILSKVNPAPGWNEHVLIVHGNRMVYAINGYMAFDATDNDPMSLKDGLIGIQVHKGPAMWIQMKDIVIKPLTSFPDITGRFITKPVTLNTPIVSYKDSTKVNLPDTLVNDPE